MIRPRAHARRGRARASERRRRTQRAVAREGTEEHALPIGARF
eukprot:COSAG02_NODE_26374_length_634_cov_1.306542_1_plen_42_part_10